MYRILFEPSGKSCEAGYSRTVMDLARENGVDLLSECGGNGTCGKCLVSANPPSCLSPASPEEQSLLAGEGFAPGERLACLARIEADGVITVLCEERACRSPKTTLSGTYPADPAVRRIVIPAMNPMNGAPDLASCCGALLKEAGVEGPVVLGREAVAGLSRAALDGGPLTCVVHAEKGVTAVLPGARDRSFGLAVDIGTTTLAAYLCDLRSGAVLGSAGEANPQRLYGEDVISRISYADENDGGVAGLQKLVTGKINELAADLFRKAGIDADDVDEVVVAGNTTMQSLFAGFHPHSLGEFPYLPAMRAPGNFRASDLGLDLKAATNVHLLPVISGFLGGDTVAAILAEGPHLGEKMCLIVDIGTNGEIVLGNRHGLWATSCATGPALEGARISCGMRASRGAIHKVAVDPGSLRVSVSVLGGEDEIPRGVCGSGIIDTCAAMRRAGLLLPTGRLVEGKPGVVCDERGTGRRFVLVPRPSSGPGREIAVTLRDIRQVQLAKAALYAGTQMLMRKAGVDRVDRVVLTGAFGARFDWANAVAIGMLPDPGGAEVRVVENSAGTGAILALLDVKRRREAVETAERVRFLELATEPGFQDVYVSAMSFPEI